MISLFKKFRDGLRKTSAKLATEIKRIVTRAPRLDADAIDELEALLISTDIGVDTTTRIIEQVREASRQTGSADVFAIARDEIERELRLDNHHAPATSRALNRSPEKPTVILMVGVNGTGKTTSTAKLAHLLKSQGHSVMLAACDTFRAAAIEQLTIWSKRTGCDIIAGQYGSDSSAVAFDALGAAINRNADYLIIDTAGRLHTKSNLMEEMKKMRRSLQKRRADTPHEVLLVLDATTGANALNQVREFHNTLGITGLVVTKLDGTAKGGIVVAIARQLKIPVKFIGLGEQIDDLQPFDPRAFAEAIFADASPDQPNPPAG
jgi:fused signal recognition particle receptor